MLNLQRWQSIAVIAFTALAVLFALPNVLPGALLDHLPGWYQQSRINLGLEGTLVLGAMALLLALALLAWRNGLGALAW